MNEYHGFGKLLPFRMLLTNHVRIEIFDGRVYATTPTISAHTVRLDSICCSDLQQTQHYSGVKLHSFLEYDMSICIECFFCCIPFHDGPTLIYIGFEWWNSVSQFSGLNLLSVPRMENICIFFSTTHRFFPNRIPLMIW